MANDVDSSVQRSGKEAGRVKWIKKTATISSSLAAAAAKKRLITDETNRVNILIFLFKVNFCKQQQN